VILDNPVYNNESDLYAEINTGQQYYILGFSVIKQLHNILYIFRCINVMYAFINWHI